MKTLLTATLLILIALPSYASELPPCPEGIYHNCFGTETFTNGNKYAGEWKDYTWYGEGTYTWADGSKYVGDFKDSKRHGKG